MGRKKLTKQKFVSVFSEVEELKLLVNGVYNDVEKFDHGNKAAGARVRKEMQEIKKQAQEIRVLVQDIKNS